MSDPWVTNVQNWLNSTYTGVPGWSPVPVTGRTGWTTMYALTRALQHELGITGLSDSFGPATLAALTAYGNIGPTTTNLNMVRIVQGAMYCKGYNGGNGLLDGNYSAVTVDGVQEMRTDMGLSSGTGNVSPKVFKALLTMDAYVLIGDGSVLVRSIQQDLNGRYAHRQDFFIIPTDGIYSRDVQRGLMLALQYEIGMADGVANGNFGPGTQTGLTSQANYGLGDSDAMAGKYFIHLYQAALIFNGYTTAYSGSFTSATQSTTTSFQAFCMLATSGRSDYQTWASLLVSTGDTSRPGTAADTIREITPDRAATLISHGYQTIGRYLTNTPVANPLDKNIKPGELANIFAAGLTIFPIFQEGGTGTSFFNYTEGYNAGQRAHDAASGYGFKGSTVLYFAVDFDALEHEVYEYVVPHFRGIRDGLASRFSTYRVGIYGSRNTCSIVSSQGLAIFSFVSGMSTGFSGNLGFPLPTNWAFDQILEYEIGSGTGWVNIDKDIKSGRDIGQSSVNIPVPPVYTELQKVLQYIYRIQLLANSFYSEESNSVSIAELIGKNLRRWNPDYTDVTWTILAGPNSTAFASYVDARVSSSQTPSAFDPGTAVEGVDWRHMMATVSAYLYRDPSTDWGGPQWSDIGGWAGDQVTLAKSLHAELHGTNPPDPYEWCVDALNGVVPSSFGPDDLHGDVYAWVAAYAFAVGIAPSLAKAIELATSNSTYPGENSFDTFIRIRWGSVANGLYINERIFNQPGDTPDRFEFNGSRAFLLNPLTMSGDFTTAQLDAVAKAVTNVIASNSLNYSPLP